MPKASAGSAAPLVRAPGGRLPRPRGPLSLELTQVLTEDVQPAPSVAALAERSAPDVDGLTDEDAQLSLAILYELHYRGFAGVDDEWEWQPDLVAAAGQLERRLLRDLHGLVDERFGSLDAAPAAVPESLQRLTTTEIGPSLSRYLAREATREQYAEFLVHRSIYHLREADPHTWAIPRLAGGPKAALVEVQSDEYGGGRADWMHAVLFATTMRGFGLDDTYGHYLDSVPAVTLAWANTMTLFGLHRRHRGAVAGHLAALEMTSSLPNRRYGNGCRRLGLGARATRFFDEHVEADAVHEQIACYDLAGQLASSEPILIGDILFGAGAALATDSLVAEHLLDSWARGRSSLRSTKGLAAVVGSGL
jgi:hypothetical protein